MKLLSGIVYSWETEFGNTFAGRRVLVTGATGFIGWHLCEALIALGADVYGLSRSASANNLIYGCKAYALNLVDIEEVRATVGKIQPDLIYHLAGMVTARQEMNLVLPMLENNLVSTVNLLQAVAEKGCDRIIITSSSEEISALSSGKTPSSPYAAAKGSASMYAKMFHKLYALPITVIQLFMSYGPKQEPTKLIPYTVLSLLRQQSPNISSGDRVCDFIYVLDVVRGLLKTGTQPGTIGKTLPLGTGKATSLREAVELLVEITDSQKLPVFGAVPDRIGEQPQIADRNAIRQMLDWEPRWTLPDGLMETVAWYKAQEDWKL